MIEIKNLSFSYRTLEIEVPIFKNFNLSVSKGEFIAIKGPSGSGKSTLLYLMAGLLKFQSGHVEIGGCKISEMSDLQLAVLRNSYFGFIFQQFYLMPKLTVLENVLLPTIYPVESNKLIDRKDSAVKLLEELGLGDRILHRPNQLSGGQQQRVAISRALINDAEIILADEPTGNLDSKSTKQIVKALKDLHLKGKTIILITHEDEVAAAASTIYYLKDGKLEGNTSHNNFPLSEIKFNLEIPKFSIFSYAKLFAIGIKNAFRNKVRSILTMLGIMVGVAAVCSLITLGTFTKKTILSSYSELGVNTLIFRGYPNWDLQAKDNVKVMYRFFDWDKEIIPLKKIFPEILFLSPSMSTWRTSASYGGKIISEDPTLVGVSQEGLKILGRNFLIGKGIHFAHVEQKNAVCVIGFEIAKRLFSNVSPIGKILHVTLDSSSFACQIIGVLESVTSNKDWSKPDFQIFVPFTFFQAVSEHWWTTQLKEISIQLKEGSDVEVVGKGIKNFFEIKYGKSGKFMVDSDSVLVAQMKKFLSLFTILLGAIAAVTLFVGGIGITNMMLVSVSERYREIGIRKSVGATRLSLRYQFLFESLILCLIAGLIGILVGVIAYQSAIYAGSIVIQKFNYEWVLDPIAIFFSLISILTVGIVSGLAPALKAEKLEVIDALRSD